MKDKEYPKELIKELKKKKKPHGVASLARIYSMKRYWSRNKISKKKE